MKTAFVVARRMAGQGGMETVVSLIMKYWAQVFWQDRPVLVVSSKTGSPAAWLDGLCYTKLWFQAYLTGYPFLIAHLFWTLRKLKPDVAIAGDYKAVKYCSWYRDLFAKNMKVACWIHSYFDPGQTRRFRQLKGADLYLCISRGLAQALTRFGAPPEKIHVVYNPSETASALPRPSVATFVYAGRIVAGREKRTDDFILALSRLRGEWRAIVAGDGKDAGKIHALARQLGIYDKIDWTGWQAKPWERIKAASCLVLTSEQESFGLVLTEAMQRGLPCLCSDFGATLPEVIQEGVNGWLYPCRNVDKLSQLMQRVIDKPGILPDSAAVQESARRYTVSAVAENMRRICLGYVNNDK